MYPNKKQNGSGGPDWQPIIPLDNIEAPQLGPPLEALPEVIGDFVAEVARVVDVSPELVLGPVMATLTGCLGTFVVVQVGETHAEAMALWSVVVCPPGERKTAVQAHVSRPVLEWEAEQAALQKLEFAAHDAEVALIEGKIKSIEQKHQRTAEDDREAALQEIRSLQKQLPDRPRLRRIILQDVTPEAIPRYLQRTGGPALILDDEGGLFGTIAGRYSKNSSSNLDAMLKGHAGSPIRVDRLGRSSDYVDHPAISLAMTIQPHVIRSMGANADFQGRGFTQRIAFIFARPRAGLRVYRATKPNPDIISRYEEAVKGLLNFVQTAKEPRHFVLRLEGEALESFRQFHDEIEGKMGPRGTLEDIKEWASKLAGLVVRVAGMFHMVAASGCDAIERHWVDAAIGYARYLIPQALAAQVAITMDVPQARAIRVLQAIEERGEQRTTTRDLHQRLRKSMKPQQINEACRVLEQHGYIVEQTEEEGSSGRRRSPRWLVNPQVLHSVSGTRRPPGTQKDAPPKKSEARRP